jgi:AraC family transcriptional activator of pyochelin receptor
MDLAAFDVTRSPAPHGLDVVRVTGTVSDGQDWTSDIPPGLTVGIATDCVLELEADGTPVSRFAGPMGFLIANAQSIPVLHRARSDGSLTATHLHLPTEAALALLRRSPTARGVLAALMGKATLDWQFWRTSPGLLTLARSIGHCPYDGAARELYLQGKALEFLALSLDASGQHEERRPAALTMGERDRLHTARGILLAEYADPPKLDALGRRVGMSVSRLTAGFRRLFGTSILEFLQEHRLNLAHDALASGRLSVSEAAWEAGYQPSSFSALFRRRFGVPPSAVRTRRQ